MKNLIIFLFVCLLNGCAGYRSVTNLEKYLPEKDLKLVYNQELDSLLQHYFTPEAYSEIKDIPLIDGPAFTPYAAGVNFWTNLASFITFNGVGRKVIAPWEDIKNIWGFSGIIHEYIHHLDDMDRDGDIEFIDHDEFRNAYMLMSIDQRWKGLMLWAEQQAASFSFWTDTFGVGEMAEHIAYVGQKLAEGEGPAYMKYVFRKILKLEYPKTTSVTLLDGKQINLVLE